MSLIKSKAVKTAARKIVESHFSKLTDDFYINLLLVEDTTVIPSMRLRHKVTGYVTKLMHRTEKGPVKKLYIEKHEEERKKLETFIPKISYLHEERVLVDSVTKSMVDKYGFQGNYVVFNDEDSMEESSDLLTEEEEFE